MELLDERTTTLDPGCQYIRTGTSFGQENFLNLLELISSIGEVRENGRGISTCFLAETELGQMLISAYHCFSQDPSAEARSSPLISREVWFPSGRIILGNVDTAFVPPWLMARDLIAFPVEEKIEIPALKISNMNPYYLERSPGLPIVCIGYPLDEPIPVAGFGNLNSKLEIGNMFLVDAPVQAGFSGGPMINRMGEVLGVITGAHKFGQGYFLGPFNKFLGLSGRTYYANC